METKDKKKIIFMKTKTCSYEDFDPLLNMLLWFTFTSDPILVY